MMSAANTMPGGREGGPSMGQEERAAVGAYAAGPGKDLYVQALRGLAIAAVVLIHCLPQLAVSVAVRPLLNFAVALFIFLSGYLTPKERVRDVRGFWGRRLGKILAPYALWTLFYLAARGELAPETVLGAMLTGGGASQMYYLLVYAQLVLLTPALYRLLDFARARAVLYATTPVITFVRIGLAIARQDSLGAMVGVFCGSWLVYYLLGLEWRERVEPALKLLGVTFCRSAIAFIVCLALQVACGMLWFSAGNYSMAVGQLKTTTMLTVIALIVAAMLASGGLKKALSSIRPLVVLGDLSFGIYLCHMAPIMVLGKVGEALGLEGILPALLVWALSLAVSVGVIWLCRQALPRRVLDAMGFS